MVQSIVNTNKKKKIAPRYEQIANDIRKKIKDIEPGEMLAPERDLAEHYSVSYMTMRKAIDVLAKEGFIKRYQGRGTIVNNRLSVGEIAVVVRPKLLDIHSSPYYQLASNLLIENIHATNKSWQVKLHLGKATMRGEEFPETLDLLAPEVLHNLRGVFTFNPLYDLSKKLEQSNVLVISMSLGDKFGKYQVGFNQADVFNLGLAHFAERGCKSIGLIGHKNYLGIDGIAYDSKVHFLEQVHTNKLETRAEWILCQEGDRFENNGYEMFMRLWNRPQHPDAILITDDVLCRGVLRAILQLGIKLPDDLCLTTYANKGVEIAYHRDLTRVEYDVPRQAAVACEMMFSLIEGKPITSQDSIIVLPGKLVVGQTT
ncbi:MAG: hypothetical protein A2Y12_06815 [Planctomycetes bacterium GWF2_42_9]|nr:MAG: hypothetical protein A2Y12_06815 [Planctomycetes bacterium GWF2_42_9]